MISYRKLNTERRKPILQANMTDVLEKCEVCGALLDEEDLFCANCGTEAPHREDSAAQSTLKSTHNFICSGCGASMSYDASAQTLRCPFCSSEQLEEQKDAKVLAPQGVVPFAIDNASAEAIMRKWLGSSFWRPGDLARAAAIEGMQAVYVPYWVFSARTHTYWVADSSVVPPGAAGHWCPVSGEHGDTYTGVLVGASGALTANETWAICPFDLAMAVEPTQIDLDNAIFEQFRVQRKYARPLAQQSFEHFESEACAKQVPGNCRNLKVNVRLEGLSGEPILLPVWIMAYRYRNQVFRFLLNGQTGRATGQAPTDWKKIGMVFAIAAMAALFGVLALALCSGAANR